MFINQKKRKMMGFVGGHPIIFNILKKSRKNEEYICSIG